MIIKIIISIIVILLAIELAKIWIIDIKGFYRNIKINLSNSLLCYKNDYILMDENYFYWVYRSNVPTLLSKYYITFYKGNTYFVPRFSKLEKKIEKRFKYLLNQKHN